MTNSEFHPGARVRVKPGTLDADYKSDRGTLLRIHSRETPSRVPSWAVKLDEEEYEIIFLESELVVEWEEQLKFCKLVCAIMHETLIEISQEHPVDHEVVASSYHRGLADGHTRQSELAKHTLERITELEHRRKCGMLTFPPSPGTEPTSESRRNSETTGDGDAPVP